MPTVTNKHGLSRPIPAGVAREVRQRCGFGCVICGAAIYDYDHLDTEFADAEIHDPDKIVLLCMRHHGLKNRKLLTSEEIRRASKNPKAIRDGVAKEEFLSPGSNTFNVRFGTSTIKNVMTILTESGRPLIWFDPPEVPGGRPQLSAYLCDIDGSNRFSINQNLLIVSTSNWDVEVSGPRLTIRRAKGDIALELKSLAGEGIGINRIDTLVNGIRFTVTSDGAMRVGGTSFQRAMISHTNCVFAM